MPGEGRGGKGRETGTTTTSKDSNLETGTTTTSRSDLQGIPDINTPTNIQMIQLVIPRFSSSGSRLGYLYPVYHGDKFRHNLKFRI